MGADGIQFAIAHTIESSVPLADCESFGSRVQELQQLRPWQALHRSEQILFHAMLQHNTKLETTSTNKGLTIA